MPLQRGLRLDVRHLGPPQSILDAQRHLVPRVEELQHLLLQSLQRGVRPCCRRDEPLVHARRVGPVPVAAMRPGNPLAVGDVCILVRLPPAVQQALTCSAGRSTGLRLSLLTGVLLLTSCTSEVATQGKDATRAASPVASSSAATVVDLDGVAVLDRGVTPWEDGVVLDDPHVLRVVAVGMNGSPTPCADAVVVRAVQQSDTEVVIEARRYELADKPSEYACTAVMLAARPHEVRLDRPLAGRKVIDASSTSPRQVISFDDFPTVQQVPAGYQWRPPSWDDARRVVTRSWGSKDGSLTLEIGPGNQLQSLPAVLKQGRIGGQAATVTRVIMLSCARWGPADQTLNLCSRDAGAGDPPLEPDELLSLGSTVG